MARWQEFVDAEAELAQRALALFDAHKHKTLATLRKDGSPRISGIEATFADGDLWLGMMTDSRKADDIRRDPRLALHSASEDPGEDTSQWPGDAKLSGRAIEVSDPDRLAAMGGGGEGYLFRVDIDEVVVTGLDDPPEQLLIQLWRPGKPLTVTRRT